MSTHKGGGIFLGVIAGFGREFLVSLAYLVKESIAGKKKAGDI